MEDPTSMKSLVGTLESPEDKKKRLISVFVCHMSMLLSGFGNSLIYIGMYPFIVSLDEEVKLFAYGMVVSADATSQMILSPILGWFIDKTKSVRSVSLVLSVLFTAGNVYYALLGIFPKGDNLLRVWMMLVARLIVGAGTTINSSARYYVSAATLLSERTTHIALFSLFQTIGFITGPGVMAALGYVGFHGIDDGGEITFDMYTIPAWISAATGVISFIIFLPGIFTEYYIAEKELDALKKLADEDLKKKQSENEGTGNQFTRRISRVVQPGQVSMKTTSPDVNANELGVPGYNKSVMRRISRVAIQEIHQEEAANGQDTNSKEDGLMMLERNLRKFSTFITADGSNVGMMDPTLDPEYNAYNDDHDETEIIRTENMMPPMLPVIVLIYCYFSFLFNFVLLETLTSTLAMDQWGWDPEAAVENMGFVTMGAAGLGAIVFSMIGPLSKRFDERLLLFVLGIIPMLIGRMIMFPIPSLAPHPPVNCFSNASWIPNFPDCETCHIDLPSTTPESSTFSSMSSPGFFINHSRDHDMMPTFGGFMLDANEEDKSDLVRCSGSGCSYEWCDDMARITVWQFMLGFVLGTVGYPFCLAISASIFSKIVGGSSNPAFWLGIFATSGSVARVAGPLLVTELYQEFGTYVMLAVVGVTLGLAALLVIIFWKYLQPEHDKKKNFKKDEDVNEPATSESDKKIIPPSVPEIQVNNAIIEEEEEFNYNQKERKEEDDYGRKIPDWS